MTDELHGAQDVATLAGVLQTLKRSIELDTNVCVPATVVTATKDLATIELGFRRILAATGEELDPIKVPGVPISYPGSGSVYIYWPLVAGDTGVAIFSDRALQKWVKSGGSVDPINSRAHDLADAIFFPGVRHSKNRPTPPASGLTIEHPSNIRLGSGATSKVALAQQIHAYINAMITAAPVAPTDGGASLKAGMLAYLSSTPFTAFAATKVSAQ